MTLAGALGTEAIAKELSSEEYYHGLLPREDMNSLLRRNGDFLVRYSEAKKGQEKSFIISVMHKEQQENDGIKHYIIKRMPNNKFMIEKYIFPSIKAMIQHHVTRKDSLVKTDEVLLTNPIKRQDWEQHHDDITLVKKLGEGAFGEVMLGKMRISRGKDAGKIIDVAVKQAKLEALTKEQIKEIMSEARLMRRLVHPNVVRFYGVATLQEPLMVIMELASNGALDSYLKKNTNLSTSKLDEMVMQAAWGIEYIHRKNVLHRDLAARNCLYGGGNVKIADFGLSREGNAFQMDPHQRVPIRWLAPEVLGTSFFTQKTDVWAFGIMSWEIYHEAQEPYPGMMVAEVAMGLRDTPPLRMDFKSSVKADVAKFIKERVWDNNANNRPSMTEIVRHLQSLFNMTFTQHK